MMNSLWKSMRTGSKHASSGNGSKNLSDAYGSKATHAKRCAGQDNTIYSWLEQKEPQTKYYIQTQKHSNSMRAEYEGYGRSKCILPQLVG